MRAYSLGKMAYRELAVLIDTLEDRKKDRYSSVKYDAMLPAEKNPYKAFMAKGSMTISMAEQIAQQDEVVKELSDQISRLKTTRDNLWAVVDIAEKIHQTILVLIPNSDKIRSSGQVIDPLQAESMLDDFRDRISDAGRRYDR